MAPKIVARLSVTEDLFAREIESASGRLSRFVTGIGVALTTVLTAPITLLAAPAVAAADAHRAALRMIRTSTGAIGSALAALGATYSQVRLVTVASAEEAAAAVGQLHRRLGLVGEDLRTASIAAVKLARLDGSDVGAAAAAAGQAMAAWGMTGPAVVGAMGQLQGAARLTEGGILGLSAQLIRGAPALRAAGLTIQESSALLADLARHGVQADAALVGLSKAMMTLAQAGATGSMGDALRVQIEAIRKSTSSAAAARMAVALFGESGVMMASAIRRGALTLESLRSMARMESAPVMTLAKAFGQLRIQVMQALEPLGVAIQRLAGPRSIARVESLARLADMVGLVTQAFGTLPRWIQGAIVVAAAIAALVGSALLFVGAIVMPLAGLALVALKAIGLIGVLGGVLGIIIAGALAAWATSGSALAEASSRAGAPGIPAALLVAGGILAGAMSAGTDASNVPAAEAFGAAVTLPAAGGLQPGQSRPEMAVPLPMTFDTAPVVIAPLVVPALPELPPLPSESGRFGAEYGWEALVSARMATSDVAAGLVPAQPALVVSAGQSLASAMRAHGARMASWYGELAQLGRLPLSFAPGGWWELNRPESWYERADEVERVQAQRQLVDAVWADQLAARAVREKEQLRVMGGFRAAFVDPTRGPVPEEMFAAGLAGWRDETITIGAPSALAQIVTVDQVSDAAVAGLAVAG
jgi:hypothetical protein